MSQSFSFKFKVMLNHTVSIICVQFLVAEEKEEEMAAPTTEDTGDVDDLVRFLFSVIIMG